jgi:hypothetical protein
MIGGVDGSGKNRTIPQSDDPAKKYLGQVLFCGIVRLRDRPIAGFKKVIPNFFVPTCKHTEGFKTAGKAITPIAQFFLNYPSTSLAFSDAIS